MVEVVVAEVYVNSKVYPEFVEGQEDSCIERKLQEQPDPSFAKASEDSPFLRSGFKWKSELGALSLAMLRDDKTA